MQRVFSAIGHELLGIGRLMGRGIAWVFRGLFSLVSRSRIALAVCSLVVVLLVGGLVDLGMNWGRAYAGVRIGEVDVAGKTADEMTALVQNVYTTRLQEGRVTVFASDEAAVAAPDAAAQAQDEALAEQRTADEERANRTQWTADASLLAATLPVEDLVSEALAIGRENGGLPARAGALFGGHVIAPRASYDTDKLETLAAEIDAAIGDPRVDFDLAIEEGVAQVTEGHDGYMVDRTAFSRELDRAFFESENGTGSFVARAEYAPLRIDRAAATATCTLVNEALAPGARFAYEDASWEATAADLGEWVVTRPEEHNGTWTLAAYVDEARAKPSILEHVERTRTGSPTKVSFKREGNDVQVLTDGTGTVPRAAETARVLGATLFGGDTGVGAQDTSGAASAWRPSPGEPVEVSVGSGPAPSTSTFDEALDLGLIGEISSYTTEYTTGSGTENRNHNIHLVADLLNHSIATAGGTWSFNGTAGECNAERGFLGAGAIIDGEYDDAVGGGICQVATTVFNAVYEAGFPVPTRHNHSLYIGSYPAGRDAAVSWPDLDLVWKNDGASDVLMGATYTEGSVTVTLYGVDPGYRVSTNVGEWTEGEKHKTKTERDESMTPGTSYVKTAGTDGKNITVIRTVTSRMGEILHEDPFYSTYDPVTEVVVAGPEPEAKAPSEDTSKELKDTNADNTALGDSHTSDASHETNETEER